MKKIVGTMLLGMLSLGAGAQSPCNGIPNAGTATTTTSSFSTCNGGNPVLDLTPVSSETGLTYMWQGSPAGQNMWSYVSGSLTSPAFTAPAITVSMDYRVVTTCTNTSDTNTSAPVTVTVAPAPTASFQVVADSVCEGTNANIIVIGTPFSIATIDSAGTNITVFMNGVGIGVHPTG
ncbi:MAG TPA: hypothetical protein VEB40_03620, partial [Flavipsychrobacter sp.]|nr:hypothetical protein [Flavipsychrobacter sp.]